MIHLGNESVGKRVQPEVVTRNKLVNTESFLIASLVPLSNYTYFGQDQHSVIANFYAIAGSLLLRVTTA